MRTRQEIALAINLLDEYGGKYKRSQIGVLHDRMTESQVFDIYVSNYVGDEKDEALFFAVREAAQYVAGKLTIQELMPNLPDGILERQVLHEEKNEETFTLSRRDYMALIQRINKLEKQILSMRKESTIVSITQSGQDYISQTEAARYIGCTRSALEKWRHKGAIVGYRSGNHLYYRRSELDVCPTIINYKEKKNNE
jgi:excisionase family DNA binding protein|nr:MAG TPA: helix-turn-helix domain protein [Caudoviricetes sp.]